MALLKNPTFRRVELALPQRFPRYTGGLAIPDSIWILKQPSVYSVTGECANCTATESQVQIRPRTEMTQLKIGWMCFRARESNFVFSVAQIQFPTHIQADAHDRMADTLTVTQNNNFIAVKFTM